MEQASPLHLARLARVQQQMAALGLTQLLVTDPDSVWYLTGYDNEPLERMMVFCVRADGQHIFFLNRLFPAPAAPWEQVWFSDTDDAVGALAARLDPAAPVGIDKTWSARFLLPLLERLPGCRPVLASDCVDHCRACKDPAEQALMKEASRINDQVMTEAAAFFREGVTEREAARFIEKRYTELGCSGPSFPTIVSFGAHGADPHHEPDDTPLTPGDSIVIDMGCRKDRYCSDMTRTYFWREASPEARAVHDLVREANQKAEALIRPGVPLCEIDRAARDHIAAAGYGEYFTHRLGHFIGQRDHEQGDVSSANTALAQPGMIFSIEPGVYLPGKFGVRIEDLVLVTETGCEILNQVDKHWKILG